MSLSCVSIMGGGGVGKVKSSSQRDDNGEGGGGSGKSSQSDREGSVEGGGGRDASSTKVCADSRKGCT